MSRRLPNMRIAIPIHSFEPGGVERVALRLAHRWQEAGEQVTIVLGRNEGRCKNDAPPLDYFTLPEPFSSASWETIWMIWSLYRFLLTERVDVLFCPGNTYTIVCVVMRLLLGERCPPVLVKISNDLERQDLPRALRPPYRFWLRIQGFFLDHFVALAGPMLPGIVERLGIGRDKATVISDPALSECELEQLSETRLHRVPSGCCFLSVGRLVSQKNHALLIEAFERHSSPDDRLVIAGEGPERRSLEALVDRRGLKDRVSLIGHSDDIAGLLEQADVFALSSDYEGVPAVVIEALAAGVPIAATDCCDSMEWLLQHGRFGVTAPVRDAHGLGAAMNAARHLTPLHREMADFVAQFTIEHAAGAYLFAMQALCVSRTGSQFTELDWYVREPHERGV